MKLCTCSLLFIKLIYMMSTASQGFSMWYISSVMVSVFASSAVDREYWLARNQNKVSERSDMSILGLLFQ
jgi:uncharacterized membrane protein